MKGFATAALRKQSIGVVGLAWVSPIWTFMLSIYRGQMDNLVITSQLKIKEIVLCKPARPGWCKPKCVFLFSGVGSVCLIPALLSCLRLACFVAGSMCLVLSTCQVLSVFFHSPTNERPAPLFLVLYTLHAGCTPRRPQNLR